MTKRYPDKLSLYLPVSKNNDLVGRLKALAKRLDRSVNYLIVEAIVEFLEREEKKFEEKKFAEDWRPLCDPRMRPDI